MTVPESEGYVNDQEQKRTLESLRARMRDNPFPARDTGAPRGYADGGTVTTPSPSREPGILPYTPPDQGKYFTRDYAGEQRSREMNQERQQRQQERIQRGREIMNNRDRIVDYNIGQAKNMGPKEFYNNVRNSGRWNYKRSAAGVEDFGNYNFGAAGMSLLNNNKIFSKLSEAQKEEFLKRGAGLYSQYSNPPDGKRDFSKPLKEPPFGDNADDQEQIQKGIDYYNSTQGEKQ